MGFGAGAEIYLLIAIFTIGEQKSVLAKQCHMPFVTGDENAKGQGCNWHSASKAAWSKWQCVGNLTPPLMLCF